MFLALTGACSSVPDPEDSAGGSSGNTLGHLPADKGYVMVDAMVSNGVWKAYPSMTVDSLGLKPAQPDRVNKYGSWADGPRLEATGFFHTVKYNGRWVIVDPEGFIHIDAAIVGINVGKGLTNKKYFTQKYQDDKELWMEL